MTGWALLVGQQGWHRTWDAQQNFYTSTTLCVASLFIAKYTRVRNSVHLVKGLQDSIPLTRPFSAPVPTLTPWPD